VTPNHQQALEVLQQRHPQASVQPILGASGEVHAVAVYVGVQAAQAATALPLAGPARAPASLDTRLFPDVGTRFIGNTSSSVWDIDFGTVDVSNGQLTVRLASAPGYGAVVDNLRLVAPDGSELLFEAEDPGVTSGDPTYADREGADGHWWLQQFEPFSGGAGLVAQPDEAVPVLTMALPAPNGSYRLHVGSFTGDPANGVFALDVAIASTP
jgi:hypothetical protein